MLTLEQAGCRMAGISYCWKLPGRGEVPWAGDLALTADSERAFSGLLAVLLFLAGPILGLVYVLLLPFIGMSMLGAIVFEKIFRGVEERAYKGAIFCWQPGEVYLAGKMGRARRTISRKEEEKKE